MNDTAGSRIKERREDLGMTQDELAKQLGYTRTWLTNIETDKRPLPGTETLLQLCKILKTSPTYILTGYEEENFTIGEELAISDRAIENLASEKEIGFDVTSRLIDVFTDHPDTAVKLYEYLFNPFNEFIVSEQDGSSYQPKENAHVSLIDRKLLGGMFQISSLEVYARINLMDELKGIREEMQNGKR